MLRVLCTQRSGPLNIGPMHRDKNAIAKHTVLKLDSQKAKANETSKPDTGLDQEMQFRKYEIVKVLSGIFQKKTIAKVAETVYLSYMFTYNIYHTKNNTLNMEL